jgi:hypothetical protein
MNDYYLFSAVNWFFIHSFKIPRINLKKKKKAAPEAAPITINEFPEPN